VDVHESAAKHCRLIATELYDGIWGSAAPTPWMKNGDSHRVAGGGLVRHYGTSAIAYEYGTSTLGACARVCSGLEILVVLELFLGYFFGAASLELTLSL